jgi:competence protein ComEC
MRSSPLLRPALIVLISLAAFVAIAAGTRGADARGPLVVTVLDVDQGDAVFVRTPRGRAILVDGGPNPPALLAALGRRMGPVERSFALAALTRADAEHLPGMVAALDRYPAGLQIGPAGSNVSALEQRWRGAAAADRLLSVDAPTSLAVEPDLAIDLFPTSPIAGPPGGDPSPQRSLILRIRYGAVAVLIAPTSTPAEIARAASAGWNISADALVVPRHGGKDSLDSGTISMVRPSVGVISVGARNREGAPTKETLKLLEQVKVLRTDLNGSVELTTDGSSLRVTSERSP